MISELIDKQDTFEIVRDQIAGILAAETVSQMALAVEVAKDPADWKLRIFLERSNPWEEWLNSQDDTSPIINVWYDSSSFNKASSNVVSRQHSTSTFNIDMYGYGKSKGEGEGHAPGDRTAALEVQRAIRLVRNILMAGTYTYLDLRGVVGTRWPQSINVFQPQLDDRSAIQVVGARLAFSVEFNEFSPQVPSVELELVSLTVDNDSGEVLIEADYDYTA